MKYIETSSKENINVTEGFQSIIDTVIGLKLEKTIENSDQNRISIRSSILD